VRGLTVRWSLAEAPRDTGDRLADYVAESSYNRFTGMPGLRFKTWRLRPGEWFEGCYVFETSQARQEFQDRFAATTQEAPGSRIVGAPPILVEPCEIVAVAEGAAGFQAAPSYR
jgi:hypothetical protein